MAMETEYSSCIPPGFRFHPTEEELVGYYLKRKINSLKIDLDVIVDIDLYRMEPWDIQDRCRLGHEERNEWYFFSHKDRKYPTGTRTNRATTAGFWKATGRDKAVISKDRIIGMRKTLVFYKGRAPNGRKTDWIMHEYRLQSSEHGPPQEEGWVVCRAFKKPNPSQKQGFEAWNYNKYLNPSNPTTTILHNLMINPCTHLPQGMNNFNHHSFPLQSSNPTPFDQNQMVDLPNLDSPSISTSFATTTNDNNNNNNFEHSTTTNTTAAAIANDQEFEDEKRNFGYNNNFNDWKRFDIEVASQVIESSSYGYTNFPYSDDDQLDAQNTLSNVFQCFPNDLI